MVGWRLRPGVRAEVVRLILEAASIQPSRIGLTRLAVRRRLAGIPRLLAWSRRSAGDVLRSYFTHDALTGTAAVFGPMVWGVSPELLKPCSPPTWPPAASWSSGDG